MNILSYGERDSNGAETNKDNCFEIIQKGERKGDTIHVESTTDYNSWVSAIRRKINPERHKSHAAYEGSNYQPGSSAGSNRGGVGFGNAGQDAMLDTIIDKLDDIDGISRMMGSEVEDQTRIIESLTKCVAVLLSANLQQARFAPVYVSMCLHHAAYHLTVACCVINVCRDMDRIDNRVEQNKNRVQRIK